MIILVILLSTGISGATCHYNAVIGTWVVHNCIFLVFCWFRSDLVLWGAASPVAVPCDDHSYGNADDIGQKKNTGWPEVHQLESNPLCQMIHKHPETNLQAHKHVRSMYTRLCLLVSQVIISDKNLISYT